MTAIEYRLYYDGLGKVVTYTTEKMDGNYIIVTPQQFAEARHDVCVVNGKLVNPNKNTTIFRLVKNSGVGVQTSKYDINIITDQDGVFWNLEQHDIT